AAAGGHVQCQGRLRDAEDRQAQAELGGGQQLAISLPDLATINDQLIASGLPAQRIRLRVASDLYIGDNSIGRIELRDITDLRGTIKVWGH
ncbi:hypothetical protein ACV36O_30570, partial [Pseudomonas aeruginosa]